MYVSILAASCQPVSLFDTWTAPLGFCPRESPPPGGCLLNTSKHHQVRASACVLRYQTPANQHNPATTQAGCQPPPIPDAATALLSKRAQHNSRAFCPPRPLARPAPSLTTCSTTARAYWLGEPLKPGQIERMFDITGKYCRRGKPLDVDSCTDRKHSPRAALRPSSLVR